MRRTDEAFRNEVVRRSNKWIIYRRQVRNKIIAACVPLVLCIIAIPAMVYVSRNETESAQDARYDGAETEELTNEDRLNINDSDQEINVNDLPASQGTPEFEKFPNENFDSVGDEELKADSLDFKQVCIEMYVDSQQVGESYISEDSDFYNDLSELLQDSIAYGEQISDESDVENDTQSEAVGINKIQYVIYITGNNGQVKTYIIGDTLISECLDIKYDYLVDSEHVEEIIKFISENIN